MDNNLWRAIKYYIIITLGFFVFVLGWYTKENTKMVMSVVRKRETGAIFRKIKEIDPEDFITMGSVMGVYGQGFEKLKL